MKKNDFVDIVVQKYRHRYPDWENIDVTLIVGEGINGHYAVVHANGGSADGEVAYVSAEGDVTIFESTEALAQHFTLILNQPQYWRLLKGVFSKEGVTATVMYALLAILGALALGTERSIEDPLVMTLVGAFGTAMGFFFGSKRQS